MTHVRATVRPFVLAAIAAIATGALLAGCAAGPEPSGPASSEPVVLTLVTHDSFALGEGVLEDFTAETGIEVRVHAAGNAGALVNSLILTKDSPLGDVVFGIDNTFASRPVEAGVLEPYVSGALTAAEAPYLLEGLGREELTPVTSGDVCVNADLAWFAEHDLAVPETLEDLIDPTYRGLTVVEAANTSSPGLAFLLATIGTFGEPGWQDYWRALVANDVKVAAGWSDAYYVDFSGPSSEGDRPLVVSYASSPLAEITDPAAPAPTGVLLDTCFRQTEYAGVIAGTAHPVEARQLVDFLVSERVQEDVPTSMWVLPVLQSAELPEAWAAHVALPESPVTIDSASIEAHREQWIGEWAAIAVP